MTNAQMQKAVYALIFQRYMVGRNENDAYALHLAKIAADDYMAYILKYQKCQTNEQIADNWQWELKTQTKALARTTEEFSQLVHNKAELLKMSIARWTEDAHKANSAYERNMYWSKVEAAQTALYNIEQYGQTETPERIYDEQQVWVGYRLKNGTEVWHSGVPTF